MGQYIYSLRKSKPLKAQTPNPITVYRFEYDFKPYRGWDGEDYNEKQFARIRRNSRHWQGVDEIYWAMGNPKSKWEPSDCIYHMTDPAGRVCFSDEGSWFDKQEPVWTCVGIKGNQPVWMEGSWVERTVDAEFVGRFHGPKRQKFGTVEKGLLEATHRTYTQMYWNGGWRMGEEPEVWVRASEAAVEFKLVSQERLARRIASYGEDSHADHWVSRARVLAQHPDWRLANPFATQKPLYGWAYDLDTDTWIQEDSSGRKVIECRWQHFGGALIALAERTNREVVDVVHRWATNNGVKRWGDPDHDWAKEKQARKDEVSTRSSKMQADFKRSIERAASECRCAVEELEREMASLKARIARREETLEQQRKRALDTLVKAAEELADDVEAMEVFVAFEAKEENRSTEEAALRFQMSEWVDKLRAKLDGGGGE